MATSNMVARRSLSSNGVVMRTSNEPLNIRDRQTMHRTIIKQGYLKKLPNAARLGSSLKKVERRWFVFGIIGQRDPYLEYYENEDSIFNSRPLNIVFLDTCRKITRNQKTNRFCNIFTLVLKDRLLSLVAPTRDAMFEWSRAIEQKLSSLGIIEQSAHGNNDYIRMPMPQRHSSHELAERGNPEERPYLDIRASGGSFGMVRPDEEEVVPRSSREVTESVYANAAPRDPETPGLLLEDTYFLNGASGVEEIYVAANPPSENIYMNSMRPEVTAGDSDLVNMRSFDGGSDSVRGPREADPVSDQNYESASSSTLPPVEYQPIGYHPGQYQPIGYQSGEYQPIGHQPAEYQPIRYQSAEYQPIGYQSVEYQPIGYQTIGHQPTGYQSIGGHQPSAISSEQSCLASDSECLPSNVNPTGITCSNHEIPVNLPSYHEVLSSPKPLTEDFSRYCGLQPISIPLPSFTQFSGGESPSNSRTDGAFLPSPPPYSLQKTLFKGANVPLKKAQLQNLVQEMNDPLDVQVAISKAQCRNTIAFVECFDRIWIGGWNQRVCPTFHSFLHIGDQLVTINGLTPNSRQAAKKLLKACAGKTDATLTIKRIPCGRVFGFNRENGSTDPLGLTMVNRTAEIGLVDPTGLARQNGLEEKAPAMSGAGGDGGDSWWVTEVNSQPLNLFFKDDEAKQRLNAVGSHLSFVVQPTQLVVEIKKQLKNSKSFRDFLVH